MQPRQPANLKSILQEAGLDPEHNCEAIRVEASHRQYFRVRLTDPGNGPATVILCAGLPAPYNDDDNFIQLSEFLRDANIPVPRVLAIDRARGQMLLSDAGDEDLADRLASGFRSGPGAASSAREALLKQAINLIVQMQTLSPPQVVAERAFDRAKLQAELDFMFDALRQICTDLDLPDPYTFELGMFLSELCRLLDQARPRVFTHRDYHTRNIMLQPGSADQVPVLTLIDYQDARMGLPYYDLASLLYDPYAPLTLADRQMGLAYFRAKSGLELPGTGMYYAQALQRMLKALGTYLFQVHQRGHRGYLSSIKAALQRIEEICQLGRFPDSVFLFSRSLLREIYPSLEAKHGIADPG